MPLLHLYPSAVGLGHATRSRTFCDEAARHGLRPTLVSFGDELCTPSCSPPGLTLPQLWRLSRGEQERAVRHVVSLAELSPPRVIVEDTHPQLPGEVGIPRLLVLRPTRFDYLQRLVEKRRFRRLFMLDHPDSPTWPYSVSETELLSQWAIPFLGPTFRPATSEQIAGARRTHGISEGEPVYIFTLGGGGAHPGSDDIPRFIESATALATQFRRKDRQARCVFVKGPLFPTNQQVRGPFEVLDAVPSLAGLLAVARGVIARPGYNTIWECIAHGVPWLPIPGTTYEEPVEQRLRSLHERELYSHDIMTDWFDPVWRHAYEERCRAVVARWSGKPDLHSFVETVGALPPEPPAAWHREGASGRRVLIIADNGVGVGHLVRCLRLAQALRTAGHEVLVGFESNEAWVLSATDVPIRLLPKSHGTPRQMAQFVSALRDLVVSHDPHMIVFDRHVMNGDALADLPDLRFRRTVALLSMPSAELLGDALERRDVDITALLHSVAELKSLYGPALTEIVARSPRTVLTGGPLLGESVLRFGAHVPRPSEPFVLFVLGGGGEHPGRDDTARIAELLPEVASELADRGLLSVVVGGPHFRHAEGLSEARLVYHRAASNLRELIGASEVVVFRPGYNLTREVLIGARAVVALRTYQHQEATDGNLALIERHPRSAVAALTPREVSSAVRVALAREETSTFEAPWTDAVPQLLALVEAAEVERHPFVRAREQLSALARRPSLVVRIDDVVEITEPLRWLLTELSARSVHASLEVIPYLSRLDDSSFNFLDEARLFEVSQHGWSHVSAFPFDHPPGEFAFSPGGGAAAHAVARPIDMGLAQLQQAFPTRFKGGFSPPYDSMPGWVPTRWATAGGKYVTAIHAACSEGSVCPILHLPNDIWDWKAERLRSPSAILQEMVTDAQRRGLATMVLHHERLVTADSRRTVLAILDTVLAGGAIPTPISRLASAAQRLPVQTVLRRYPLSRTNTPGKMGPC